MPLNLALPSNFILTQFERDGEREVNVRKVAELPFHLYSGGRITECVELLQSLEFAAAKCSAGLLYDLLQVSTFEL